MKVKAIFVSAFLVSSLLTPAEATAQTFKSIPATKWVHVYGSGESSNLTTSQPSRNIEIGPPRSSWKVEFIDVPNEAKPAFQRAIDIWASHFESTVSIEVRRIGNLPHSMASSDQHVQEDSSMHLMGHPMQIFGTHPHLPID